MSTSFVIILSLFHRIHQVLGNAEIDCKTFRSTKSSSSSGALATSRCTTAYPTMVSCGFETFDDTEQQFGGSYIDDSHSNDIQCIAINPDNGGGIYSFARCCNFDQDVVCVAADGTEADSQDELSTLQCNSNQYMLGCTGFMADPNEEQFDGVYPGIKEPDSVIQDGVGTGSTNPYTMDHTCNAQNGNWDKTQANINCCTASLGLECNVYYADGGRKRNYLGCPNGQSMMACMGWNKFMQANAMFITPDDVSNYNQGEHVCTTISSESASGDSANVYTSAICCSQVTESPTMDPTEIPTTDPTTTSPTKQPTLQPSDAPTRTRSPTENPTSTTLAPTAAPSFSPTISTDTPTGAPTLSPSAAPTRKTRDPTPAPTLAPSNAPSMPTVSPTDLPTKAPVIPRALNQGDDDGDNETLYLILFIVFGVLFCCLLLGLLYYCYRKNKQKNEINYNNAHVAVAGQSVNANDDYVASALGKEGGGTTVGETTGATTTGATTGTTTGATAGKVDASYGYQVSTPQGTFKATTTGGAYQSTTAGTSNNSPGYGVDGMSVYSDEDDQKADVYRVQM